MSKTEQYIDRLEVSDEQAELGPERAHAPDELINAASLASEVPREVLLSEDQTREVVHARWIAMILMRRQDYSTTEIGRYLGGKDHTTAMYGLRKGMALLETDADFQSMVLDADARLQSGEAATSWIKVSEPDSAEASQPERKRARRPKRKRRKRTAEEIEAQRGKALEKANETYSRRAALKLSITRGESNVGDVLRDSAVHGMKLVDLVMCIPRKRPHPHAERPANSKEQARLVLLRSGIRDDRVIEDLSVVERRSLSATLEHMKINWAVRGS